MFTLTSSLTGIKKSQFVYFVEDKSDLEYLDFLDLDKKIIKKIESSLKKDTSEKLTFFLGNPDFENLHVFVYNAHKDQSFIDFVSKKIKTIGNDFTFSSQNRKKISDLLKSVVLSTYKFDQYKSEKKETNIYFYTDEKYISELEDTYQLTQNIILARELGETPSSDLTPEIFAKLVKKTKFKNIKVKILTPKQVEKKGLGLLWGVGKASVNKPYVVILEKVVDKKAPTIGIVGKGVTFDTGGIQVKPGDHMYEMKGDMCGAATVFATMKELDEKDISVNIVAALGLAENSISGEGYKPSDILTAYNGKTVDIIHTDAEGRLVMADVMSYISDKYKLDSLMTVATLTGACMVALGYRYAGIMGNDEKVITSLLEYSQTNEEKYCRLPYDQYFINKAKSDIADLENLNRGVYAGATMGAAFLSHFLDNEEKYTHLDIAGPALNEFEDHGYMKKGMTGFGVDSLSHILQTLK